MSAQILDFPGTPPQLQLPGYVLIAWAHTADGDVFADTGDHYQCLWKPASGKGWYEAGHYYPAYHCAITGLDWRAHINRGRMSRANAIKSWRRNPGNPRYHWHYMESEAQAFPEKRRYLRPSRIGRVPSMA